MNDPAKERRLDTTVKMIHTTALVLLVLVDNRFVIPDKDMGNDIEDTTRHEDNIPTKVTL